MHVSCTGETIERPGNRRSAVNSDHFHRRGFQVHFFRRIAAIVFRDYSAIPRKCPARINLSMPNFVQMTLSACRPESVMARWVVAESLRYLTTLKAAGFQPGRTSSRYVYLKSVPSSMRRSASSTVESEECRPRRARSGSGQNTRTPVRTGRGDRSSRNPQVHSSPVCGHL